MQTQELLDFVESEGETQDLMSASGLQSWDTERPAWWPLSAPSLRNRTTAALRGAPVALWGRSLHGPLSALPVSSARSLEQLSNNLQGLLRSQVSPAFTSAAVQHSAIQCK
jgi:hypothetical protein